MRIVRMIIQAVRELGVAVLTAALLYIAARHLRPSGSAVIHAEISPFTTQNLPWVLVAAAVPTALWLRVRSRAGGQRAVWAACLWLVRIATWWGIAALLLFLGVVIYGITDRNLSDLNWRFSLGYLLTVVSFLAACVFARRRTTRAIREST